MATTQTNGQKRTAVEHLNFGAKTAKRVAFEAWSFTVVGPNELEVRNESYGDFAADHTYVVSVEERDDVVVPVACECPADEYNDDYACKHRVAAATVSGSTVLRAAIKRRSAVRPSSDSNSMRSREELKADGGATTQDSTHQEACPNGDPMCDGPDGDGLPCFPCYMDREGSR